MKRYFSKLTLALAVALVMSLGIAIPAFAASGEDLTPINIAITKELDIPAGTTVPASTFYFQFTQLMEESAGTWVPSVPATATLPNVSASFAAGNAGGFVDSAAPNNPVAQATNILAGGTWPAAGDFFFRVTEIHTAPTTQFTAPDHMEYSTASWILIIRVANVPNGDGTYTLVPRHAYAALPTVGTDGTDTTYTWNEGAKVMDIEPGIPGTDGNEGRLMDPSQMRFTNVFTRDIVGSLTDPALAFSKEITGTYADRTTMFDFNSTIVIPAAAVDRVGGTITATVVDSSTGAPVSPLREVTFSGTTTMTASFTIGNNETLAFPTLPAGTSFAVTETQQDNWRGSVTVTVGSAAPVTVSENVGVNVASGTHIVSDEEAGGVLLGNTAAFVNDYVIPPLTGLLISSMPILAALIAAAFILAMMVASRSRKRIEQLTVA